MKIIQTDNFDRDTESDSLVCENINEYYGRIVVEHLNEKLSSSISPYFFQLVKDDHKLFEVEI